MRMKREYVEEQREYMCFNPKMTNKKFERQKTLYDSNNKENHRLQAQEQIERRVRLQQ